MHADPTATGPRRVAGAVLRRTTAPAVRVCILNIIAIVFLQRIIVPLGGELGVSCLLPIAALSLLYLLLSDEACLDTQSLLACTLFLSAALVSQLLGGATFSVTSLMLLMAIYLMCTVRVRITYGEYTQILSAFQRCMVVVAGLTLLQYVTQIAGLGMPILEDFVPERLIAKDFIYLQEVVWGSGIQKPNALVMLEASFLSQFLALALIVEFWIFRRSRMLLLFGATLVLTFSGTGMMLVAVCIGIMMLKRGLNRSAAILLLALGCVGLALAASGLLDAIVGRLEEFSRSDSSGSTRFIAPFRRFMETLSAGDLRAILWGAGAGFIDKEVGFAWNPPTKVWVEYGLVVFIAYLFFLASLMRATPAPMIALALALEYLFLSGALLQPPIVFACFFLGIGYATTRKSSATPFVDRTRTVTPVRRRPPVWSRADA